MSEQLARKYRPSTFADMQGQPGVSLVLPMMVAQQNVPSALLLHGTRGSGKTTAARVLAAAMNCLGQRDGEPCNDCGSCKGVATNGSLDVMEVDAASHGLVEQVRKITDIVAYDTVGDAPYRVVVLDEAHGLSKPAWDALLKTLEEPPEHARFVLVTTEPARIPGTILSRCMPFRFRRIPVPVITARLGFICERESIGVDPLVLPVIADRADGSMRDAIVLLDQMHRAQMTTVADFYALTGESDFAPALVKVMAKGGYGEVYAVLDAVLAETGDCSLIAGRLIRCLRDVLVLRAGGDLVMDGESLERRRELAGMLSEARIVGAMRVLWDLLKVRPGAEPAAALSLAVVMAAEQLSGPAAAGAPNGAAGNGSRRATQGEVAEILRGA